MVNLFLFYRCSAPYVRLFFSQLLLLLKNNHEVHSFCPAAGHAAARHVRGVSQGFVGAFVQERIFLSKSGRDKWQRTRTTARPARRRARMHCPAASANFDAAPRAHSRAARVKRTRLRRHRLSARARHVERACAPQQRFRRLPEHGRATGPVRQHAAASLALAGLAGAAGLAVLACAAHPAPRPSLHQRQLFLQKVGSRAPAWANTTTRFGVSSWPTRCAYMEELQKILDALSRRLADFDSQAKRAVQALATANARKSARPGGRDRRHPPVSSKRRAKARWNA